MFRLLPDERVRRLCARHVRMTIDPMPGNIYPPAYPDPVMTFNVVQKQLQCSKPSGVTEQSAMHPDGKHFGRLLALGIEHIECVTHITKKIVADRKSVV